MGGGVHHNGMLYYAVSYGTTPVLHFLRMNANNGSFAGSRYTSTMECVNVRSIHKYSSDPSNIR
jgi:hypothetical protein